MQACSGCRISFHADDSLDKPTIVSTDSGTGSEEDRGATTNVSLRTESTDIRVTPEEKAEPRAAAERAGLAMTPWARMLLLREAKAATA